MADLLGEVDTNVASSRVPVKKPIKSETRRKVRILSPPSSRETRIPKSEVKNEKTKIEDDGLPGGAMDLDDGGLLPDADDNDAPMSDPLPSSPTTKAVERKSFNLPRIEEKPQESDSHDDDDDMLAVVEATGSNNAKTKSVNMTGKRPPPVVKQPTYPSPMNSSPPRINSDAIDPDSWKNVTSKLNVLSSPASDVKRFGKLRAQDAVEEDGSLRFFWLDYLEINGSLCLFGKVKDKSNGGYASTFVKIDQILRKLYFLPREHRSRHGQISDEEVEMEDVYQEVDEYMSKMKVGMHKIKSCTRKYAFELANVPKSAEYLKLMYPYDKPALPMDVTGETFSHVFGTNTSLFEQFVLWKNIMGPCWLNIEEADFSAVNGASWCKLECQVSNPGAVSLLSTSEDLDTPTLTLMSLSFRTQLNVKENKQEILVVSARVYEGVSPTDTTPPEKLPCKTFTVMRPSGSTYPIGFEAETRKHRGTFMLEKNEQFLLSKFLALFERMDPDVIMGHQLQEVDLSILINRLRDKRTPGWHRIGRMKRAEWPQKFTKAASFFGDRQLVAGRLICDIGNDMGKVSLLFTQRVNFLC